MLSRLRNLEDSVNDDAESRVSYYRGDTMVLQMKPSEKWISDAGIASGAFALVKSLVIIEHYSILKPKPSLANGRGNVSDESLPKEPRRDFPWRC